MKEEVIKAMSQEKHYYRFPGQKGIKKYCTEQKAKKILEKLRIKGCPEGSYEEISKEEFKRKEKTRK